MKVKRAVAIIAGVLIGVFAADAMWFSYRNSNSSTGNALGTVTYYYAAALKDGKAEVYFDQPQTEPCVHSLFPHIGYKPCWYASRKSNVRTIN